MAAKSQNLRIYDRQALLTDSPYAIPEELRPFVNGGLSYDEMLEAYRRFAVFLNVNSVQDSPTMFSRRVVEALSSGAAMVSGPGQGMDRVFHGLVPIARSETEAEEIIRRLRDDPAFRLSIVAASRRTIQRGLYAEHWLQRILEELKWSIPDAATQAGYVVDVTLDDEQAEDAVGEHLDALFHQSHKPERVRICDTPDNLEARFGKPVLELWARWARHARVDFRYLGAQDTSASEYEFAAPVGGWLGNHCVEDLIRTGDYSSARTIEKNRWVDYDALAQGTFRITECAVQSGDSGGAAHPSCALFRRDGDAASVNAKPMPGGVLSFFPTRRPRVGRTILFAGHDLKFIARFYDEFEARGYRVLVDHWQGHAQHDEEESQRLLKQADIIFCEWMLGNAVWYSRHAKAGQTLVARLHRQEVDTDYPLSMDVQKFQKVFYVSEHTRDEVLNCFGWDFDSRHVVLGNGVKAAALNNEKSETAPFTLGLVGMVPSLKQPHLALDILAELRQRDPRFTLRVKGKRPSDYKWLREIPGEHEYYKSFWKRLKSDRNLTGGVFFDPHDNEVEQWYSGVGFVLSTSKFESFHMTVADGAASRATPILLRRTGAGEVFCDDWISESVKSAAFRILRSAYDRKRWREEGEAARQRILSRYDLPKIAARMVHHIEMDDFCSLPEERNEIPSQAGNWRKGD